jgi:hypothetical protein
MPTPIKVVLILTVIVGFYLVSWFVVGPVNNPDPGAPGPTPCEPNVTC